MIFLMTSAIMDWEQGLHPLLPIRRRLTCGEVLQLVRPLLDRIAPEPDEGWLNWVYQVSVMQTALTGLYPGTLVLSLNAEVIYHRLVRRIVEINGVPAEPTHPRVLGPKMCVPFGKILRGDAIPNTVTKTIHTDKVFAQDLRSFSIETFPGYTPLESQIRTVNSFRRPIILVDDLLHSGNRLKALVPMLQKENVPIDRVLVGLMSGKGRDLMRTKGIRTDSVYFVPNMRAWFVESTMPDPPSPPGR